VTVETEESDDLALFIDETVGYIEQETGVRPPVAPLTFAVAVQGAVAENEGSGYQTVVLLCTHPDNPALQPFMFGVPQALIEDLFTNPPVPEEETDSE
jgi:hypothetical protein